MIDYNLSFQDEQAATSCLLAAKIVRQWEGGLAPNDGFAVDKIGVVTRGEKPPTPYLVNVRAKEAVTDAAFLAAVIPAPQYPLRVWA